MCLFVAFKTMTLSGYEALFFWVFALAAIFVALLTVMGQTIYTARQMPVLALRYE